MKFKYLFIVGILLSLYSCSSIKVLNSWKSDDFSEMKTKNILVIARTKDKSARIALENELVSNLKNEGLQASASYKMYSMLEPDKKISEKRADSIKQVLKEKGFNGIVLTVVKDVEKFTKTEVTNDNDFYAGGMYYPSYYRGFYGYYVHPMSYVPYSYSYDTNKEIKTYTSANYVLETVVYNLDNEKEKQLVGIVSTRIEEPSDIDKTSKNYVDKIVKRFQ